MGPPTPVTHHPFEAFLFVLYHRMGVGTLQKQPVAAPAREPENVGRELYSKAMPNLALRDRVWLCFKVLSHTMKTERHPTRYELSMEMDLRAVKLLEKALDRNYLAWRLLSRASRLAVDEPIASEISHIIRHGTPSQSFAVLINYHQNRPNSSKCTRWEILGNEGETIASGPASPELLWRLHELHINDRADTGIVFEDHTATLSIFHGNDGRASAAQAMETFFTLPKSNGSLSAGEREAILEAGGSFDKPDGELGLVRSERKSVAYCLMRVLLDLKYPDRIGE